MLIELRGKPEITLPMELVARLGLKEGDKLEVTEKDGVIQLIPVVVYPKKLVDKLKMEFGDAKVKITAASQPVFNNIDSLLDKMEN